MGMSLFGIIGFAMLLGSGTPHVQYAGTFLGAMGIYPCISNTITWTANNVEGVYKRGITLGFVIGWGNLNGMFKTVSCCPFLVPQDGNSPQCALYEVPASIELLQKS